MEDRQIIELFLQRSESAIVKTDEKYGGYCKAISNNILNNLQDVEECVNDTYHQTWNSIPPTIPACLRAYLGKIVRNISLNCLKARHTKKRGAGEYESVYEELSEVLSNQETVEAAVDEILLKDAIYNWLATLPQDRRSVFVGRYWYFDSIETISSKMGFSKSKTKMMLLRLRENLKECLKEEGFHI
ncbi:MAG: RNA polymerase sigma factor [Agathobacter sp.]